MSQANAKDWTGWNLWQAKSPELYLWPAGGDWLEIHREEWEHPLRVLPAHLHPFMNVAGLYWREFADEPGARERVRADI